MSEPENPYTLLGAGQLAPPSAASLPPHTYNRVLFRYACLLAAALVCYALMAAAIAAATNWHLAALVVAVGLLPMSVGSAAGIERFAEQAPCQAGATPGVWFMILPALGVLIPLACILYCGWLYPSAELGHLSLTIGAANLGWALYAGPRAIQRSLGVRSGQAA